MYQRSGWPVALNRGPGSAAWWGTRHKQVQFLPDPLLVTTIKAVMTSQWSSPSFSAPEVVTREQILRDMNADRFDSGGGSYFERRQG